MTTDTAPRNRLLAKIRVDAETGCWIWLGARSKGGYGRFFLAGRHTSAHRAAYQLFVGAVPEAKHVDHRCRNRICVNPGHLRILTPKENVHASPIAKAAVNALKTHCPKGHPYDAQNTEWDKNGGRSCKACRRARTTLGVGKGANNRLKTECPRGHPYEGPSVRITKAGRRVCRLCHALRERQKHGNGRGLGWRGEITHCLHGHAFDEANTYITPGGERACRTCARERARKRLGITGDRYRRK